MITIDCPLCAGEATTDEGLTLVTCDGCGTTVPGGGVNQNSSPVSFRQVASASTCGATSANARRRRSLSSKVRRCSTESNRNTLVYSRGVLAAAPRRLRPRCSRGTHPYVPARWLLR